MPDPINVPIPYSQPALPTVPQVQQSGLGGVVPQPTFAPPPQFGAANVVQDTMNQFTNPNSAYMRSATLHGLDQAASRGNLNGSIAAGASRRASVDAAMPLVQEATNLQKSRESYASQDWLASNQFDREFSGSLALLPIKNSYDMLNTLMSYGAENPSVYTPTVMSGLNNFFNQNMKDVMHSYFGGVAS